MLHVALRCRRVLEAQFCTDSVVPRGPLITMADYCPQLSLFSFHCVHVCAHVCVNLHALVISHMRLIYTF